MNNLRKIFRRGHQSKWKMIILSLILFVGFAAANKYIPSQHLPWRHLNPNAPVGVSTSLQLTRLSLSPSATCESLIQIANGFRALPADPKEGPDVCGWKKAQWVNARGEARLSPPNSPMQCPLAVGVHIWLGELDKTALNIFGDRIIKIHHAGTYSCRRQVGNSSGAWSEHAFANAWDITGFTLESGEVISILKDWDGSRDKKRFLRAARNKACDIFHVTLSPDYNAAHRDHFHLDMGPTSTCR